MTVVTILRDPLDKAFSRFFKKEFPGVIMNGKVDHFGPHDGFDPWLGPGSTRGTSGVLNNLTAVMGALRYYMANVRVCVCTRESERMHERSCTLAKAFA